MDKAIVGYLHERGEYHNTSQLIYTYDEWAVELTPASALSASPSMIAFNTDVIVCYGSDVYNHIGLNQIKCDCFHRLVVMVLSIG